MLERRPDARQRPAVASLDALVEATALGRGQVLQPGDGHTSVFVSFSQEEAKEKILVARQVFEELPLAYQKKLIVDSKTELAFESNSAGRRVSRILSVPSKAPRGKKGDVLLDELAHIVNDREVYTGSTALILRSQGQLTGCSSPLGRRGIFWEIAAERRASTRSSRGPG